jgi:hypothetical protein
VYLETTWSEQDEEEDQGSRRLDMGVIIEEIFDDSSVEEEQPRGGNGNGNEHDTCREKGTTSRIVEAYEQGSDSVSPTTTTDTAAAEEEDWVEVEEPSFDDEEGADGINSGRRVQENGDDDELLNPYIHFNQGDEDVEEVISEEERKRRMEEAEEYRKEGNRLFKEQNYIEALVRDWVCEDDARIAIFIYSQ